MAAVTVLIALLAMLGPFSIDTMFPAFDLIAGDFSVDALAMQQVTSVYLLSFALMSLWHGPLSDALGRRPVIVGGLAVYTAASVLCALAPSLPVLLVGRALQGLAAGGAQIISRTVIRDVASGPAAQRMMSQVNMIFGVAPAVAPIVGGLILGVGTWHWTFWFLVGSGGLLLVLTLVTLPETLPPAARHPLSAGDVVGSLRTVLADRTFLLLAATSTFAFATQFLYIVAAPIIMLTLLGKGEQDFWMLFVPVVGGLVLGAFVAGRLAARVAPLRLAKVGLGVVTGGALGNVALALLPATSGLPWVFVMPAVMSFGVQLAFPVLQLLMLDRFPRMRGAAASAQAFVSLLFNALLSGAVAAPAATSMLSVAVVSAGFGGLGLLCWVGYRRTA